MLLIVGCVLLLGMAGALLHGYGRTRRRLLLWMGLGFVGTTGVALVVGSFFVLVPAFVVALLMYLGASDPSGPGRSDADVVLEVVYRVQAPQARVAYRAGGAAVFEVSVQGAWTHAVVVPPGVPLGLSAAGVVGAPLVAELWCDGVCLGVHRAPPEAPVASLTALARAAQAGAPGSSSNS